MKLIADSGSTKTDWCLLGDNNSITYFDTEGFNPYYVDAEYIYSTILSKLPATVDSTRVSEVYFYGAGCSGDKNHILETALGRVFTHAHIEVQHDLLAAARAVLGNDTGFVAILGTGANSCIFDGKTITHQIDSLGFMLGDEGSGAYIGKQLLVRYGRGQLPEDLRVEFWNEYGLTPDDVVEHAHSKPLPNRFCASFVRFMAPRMEHPYIAGIIRKAFTDCFENMISLYPDFKLYSLNCVGSIGYMFSAILTDVAKNYGMRTGNIIKAPIEGLINYHAKATVQPLGDVN
ncbi:N-acetylglucosamine kinase [Mucilaginibacter sp. UR6-1]|uniref:N-acetylglucosamine kinase n=1 Tax=Mucilaginibacter sp. UR6-1 TaxID=1435643 RepID=UPI001E3B6C9C|nr:N-acetylglucosamine kinase [Mucilaginibacter sp. UR6-1]MCC8410126.1 N-acetylglucosamine kinase [Mucilaginibacter sp. UR6-1]